jgi:enediyne biosynthesis protein E4
MRFLLLTFLVFFVGCVSENTEVKEVWEPKADALFRKLSKTETGIDFVNELITSEDFDVFRYRNFYNGGGVGIGDINNDGLSDIYLTSNMGKNRLYLNKGNFTFEDITDRAGVAGTKIWSTGVSLADVNGDGWLDIYVCNSGDVKGNRRENELFINNGNLTFTERAATYGLADKGFSTHAVFFDYDRDNDLDCYVLNNSFLPISTLGFRNLRDERDPNGGDKLFRNDNGRFVDVSTTAGIFGSIIGFGLGVTVGDVNRDNWPDLYVSNDFYERDYLYINNTDGTFSEKLEEYMSHISMFSMGADMGDLNNDGYPEIFSTDMLPEDNRRLKTMSSFETYDVYQLRLKNGYYHQYMRNMLQLNNRGQSFSEIGQLAGVSATDWSWGALIADFDNDGYKEILVCNGIYKDLTDQDFVEYLGSSEQVEAVMKGKKVDFKHYVEKMKSQKLSNYMFKRRSDLQYRNVALEWGLDEPSFSNGAAYGDLDNDGDLDLVINNVNQEIFVYKNQTQDKTNKSFLTFTFEGPEGNKFGLGVVVDVILKNGEIVSYEYFPTRGFQSSMDYKMTIGLGDSRPDSIYITWPDGKMQVLHNPTLNQNLRLRHKDAVKQAKPLTTKSTPLFQEQKRGQLVHVENDFNDFDRDRLLYHMLSTQGPAFASGDVNRDGMEDMFLGGAAGVAGKLFVQTKAGLFRHVEVPAFYDDRDAEDVSAEFFDADNDGDLDLYVVSGGSENLSQSSAIVDRLYYNESEKTDRPLFKKANADRVPALYNSGSCVRSADIDNDGDLDLFVGNHSIPSYYGISVGQSILINDGSGRFTDRTKQIAPGLERFGMVTDAVWFNFDKNGYPDLMVVGEWLSPAIFINNEGKLEKLKNGNGLDSLNGWWNSVSAADIDKDGDTDFLMGNLGLNSKFQPSPRSPISLYVNDFDQNGSMEPIFTFTHEGREYPFALRQDLIKQMSSFKKKFVYFRDYADKQVLGVVEEKLLNRADKLKFYEARSGILKNEGDGRFTFEPFPLEAQFSPVYSIAAFDANDDGNLDLVAGGNLFSVKPEVGRYDAMAAILLLVDGLGGFTPIPKHESGLDLQGQVRAIALLSTKQNRKELAFILNDDTTKFYLAK